MDEINLEHRLTEQEQRSKDNTRRLDNLEPIVNEIHTMSKTMVQLVGEVQHTNEAVGKLDAKVDRMDGRVDNMEKAPAKEWSNAKRTVFNTLLGAITGFLIAGLMLASVMAFGLN